MCKIETVMHRIMEFRPCFELKMFFDIFIMMAVRESVGATSFWSPARRSSGFGGALPGSRCPEVCRGLRSTVNRGKAPGKPARGSPRVGGPGAGGGLVDREADVGGHYALQGLLSVRGLRFRRFGEGGDRRRKLTSPNHVPASRG